MKKNMCVCIIGDFFLAQSVKNLAAMQELGLIPVLGRAPGKEMATYSCILTWEIPRTEEPGGLQSMGLQRVGHDLVTKPPPMCN